LGESQPSVEYTWMMGMIASPVCAAGKGAGRDASKMRPGRCVRQWQ
jgi:hypothetical protein